MSYGSPVLHKVKLVGKTERATKIIKYYNNDLYLVEYDEYGFPLNISPNGSPAIYCMSPNGEWEGWFILDEEVIFEKEQEKKKIIEDKLYEYIE